MLSPYKVLVVEDRPDLAKAEVAWLQAQGAIAQAAYTAAEGLSQANSGNWDIVLLDLCLPDSSGEETMKKFQKQFPTLPVVVLTGTGDPKVGLAILTLGAQDFIHKGDGMKDVGIALLKAITRHKVRGRFELMEASMARFESSLEQFDKSKESETLIKSAAAETMLSRP